MPVGVVVRRRPGVTRWAAWDWRAVALLPGAGPAEWQELRRDGETVDYHAATARLELHGAETEAYLHNLAAEVPSLYVVLRKTTGAHPYEVLLVTASPYEGQDYAESGDDLVEPVPMPHGLAAWVRSFIEEFHHERVFEKRQRDKRQLGVAEDGIGDPRIAQTADVYRAPGSRRRRLS
ncbi:MAG: molybdopterin-guanine dinucleotide biosynthesis protein MobA [Rhodobacteraceae bacterium]|nr:molybdopterin-guanine dinucleotide biosynthesis protein MobA [Paracoccaceae bacterium]